MFDPILLVLVGIAVRFPEARSWSLIVALGYLACLAIALPVVLLATRRKAAKAVPAGVSP